jgi:hypothetical protein
MLCPLVAFVRPRVRYCTGIVTGALRIHAAAPGVPHELFHPPANGGWDVTADGKRFLVEVQPGQQNTQTPI